MNFFYRRLPGILIGATLVVVQPQLVVAITSGEKIDGIAKEFTVLIGGDNTGSGVILKRQGDTYFVLTNYHVVKDKGIYEIKTPDGISHKIDDSKEVPGLDLAVLQFTSKKSYPLANIGNSDQIREGMTVYVAGWANSLPGISKERSYLFTLGRIQAFLHKSDNGYALVYNNEAIPGMSGGPVLDENGRVVGINAARLDQNLTVQGTRLLAGWRLGIPIENPKIKEIISRPSRSQ